MHERLYLMWMGMYGIDLPATAALGDADDIRTFVAMFVQIDSAISRLEDAIVNTDVRTRYTPGDAVIKIVRAWDGLDGEEDIRVLREALEVLVRRAAALGVDVDG